MPGYYEEYELAVSELSEKDIHTVISFTSLDEIRIKSPTVRGVRTGDVPPGRTGRLDRGAIQLKPLLWPDTVFVGNGYLTAVFTLVL
jgi:hypothetical protein